MAESSILVKRKDSRDRRSPTHRDSLMRTTMAIGILLCVMCIGCTGRLAREQERLIGEWQFLPGSRCEPTDLVSDELLFVADGTYTQTTNFQTGARIFF